MVFNIMQDSPWIPHSSTRDCIVWIGYSNRLHCCIQNIGSLFNSPSNIGNSPSLDRHTSITVVGADFGKGFQYRSRSGGTAAGGSTWVSTSCTVSSISIGVGGEHTLFVTYNSFVGSLRTAYSYRLPYIVRPCECAEGCGQRQDIHLLCLSRINVPSSGSIPISLIGQHFVFVGYSQSGRAHSTATFMTQWNSDTQLVCLVSSGVGKPHAILVSVGVQSGSTMSLVTFDAPQLSSVKSFDIPTSGSNILDLHGTSFGFLNYSPKLLSGRSCQLETFWLSASTISSKFASGNADTATVTLSVGKQSSNFRVTHPRMSVSDMTIMHNSLNGPSSGCVSVSIVGRHFSDVSPSGAVRSGSTSMMAHVWRSDSCIVGKSSHSHVVAAVTIVASLHSTASPSQVKFSFNAMIIRRVSTDTFESSGGTSVTISSSNFGLAPVFCMKARLGRSSCEVSTWLSESGITCRCASALMSTNVLAAEVSFSKQISEFQTQQFPYPGVISSIHRSNFSGTGAMVLSLFSAKFGIYSVSSSTLSYITRSDSSKWVSFSFVLVTFSKGVSNLANQAIIASVSSENSQFNGFQKRDIPSTVSIKTLPSSNFATSGSRSITIDGLGFATDHYSPTTSTGFLSAMSSVWFSDSSLKLKYSRGLPFFDLYLLITCDNQRGSIVLIDKLFSFEKVVISIRICLRPVLQW